MNRYYIGVIVFLMTFIALFLNSQDKALLDEKITMDKKNFIGEEESKDQLLSPDELWEARQKKEKIDILPKKNTETKVAGQQLKLSTKRAIVSSDNILSPDEIWEEQRNENYEFDLPATTPDELVVSVEQLESERAFRNLMKGDDSSLIDEMVEKSNDSLSDDFPPIESSGEVVPFELKELETLSKTRLKLTKQEEYQDPLLDPDTGLSDQVMQTPETEPPIEPDNPIN